MMETNVGDYSAFAHRQTSAVDARWAAAGQMIKDHYNDKELREKALMYAVKVYSEADREKGVTFFAFADLCYAFLCGDDAFLKGAAA